MPCYISKYIFFNFLDFIFYIKNNIWLPGGSWRLTLGIYKSNNIKHICFHMSKYMFFRVSIPIFTSKITFGLLEATCSLSRGWTWCFWFQFSHQNSYLASRRPLGAYLEAVGGCSWTFIKVTVNICSVMSKYKFFGVRI